MFPRILQPARGAGDAAEFPARASSVSVCDSVAAGMAVWSTRPLRHVLGRHPAHAAVRCVTDSSLLYMPGLGLGSQHHAAVRCVTDSSLLYMQAKMLSDAPCSREVSLDILVCVIPLQFRACSAYDFGQILFMLNLIDACLAVLHMLVFLQPLLDIFKLASLNHCC